MPDSNDLTAREMEVLGLAWQCMDSDPKIDYTKLAQLTGYTPGSASVTFGKIKRKLKAKAAGSSAVSVTPKKAAGGIPKTPKTPKSGKRGATEDAATGTPSKKGKKASKAVNDEEEDEFDNLPIKKEEVAEVNAIADGFFKEATAYAAFGDDQQL
ncbi:hypothetical protein C7974DRAFT_234414 [Boeremia exigua]|uniref:uncharacterized protein n=1 Tax=Boeremia exigua TaxID=749465 RepID=UPI001E8DBF45|nr:uncharacterized protein C7974DRAFT_234414 [Boeremia exigua]KAH6620452.1 hypothetical protein C7974DRAFT_234414 [Boeremia exigua]